MPKRHSALALLAAIPLGFTACAHATSGEGSDSPSGKQYIVEYPWDARGVQRLYTTPLERVWAALPGLFEQMGFPGSPSADGAVHLYLTPPMLIRQQLYPGEFNSAYLDCGKTATGSPAADAYEVTFSILMWLKEEGPRATTAEILVHGTARDRGTSSNRLDCWGTGRLEGNVLRQLAVRLGIQSFIPRAGQPGESNSSLFQAEPHLTGRERQPGIAP